MATSAGGTPRAAKCVSGEALSHFLMRDARVEVAGLGTKARLGQRCLAATNLGHWRSVFEHQPTAHCKLRKTVSDSACVIRGTRNTLRLVRPTGHIWGNWSTAFVMLRIRGLL
jgi:hypothetical protein